jgi:hypothetical protein
MAIAMLLGASALLVTAAKSFYLAAPRGGNGNVGIMAVVGGILLIGCGIFVAVARRYLRWRRGLLAASAHGHEGEASL